MKKTNKYMKKPSYYQRLLHLSDIQSWKKLPRTIAEVEVEFYGFHSCVFEDKITIVVK